MRVRPARGGGFREFGAKADTGVVAVTRETARGVCVRVRAGRRRRNFGDKNTHTSCQLRVSLFSCQFVFARAALMLRDNACAVAWLETRALRRWMQKSQDGDPFAVHTLRARKCVASDAMRSTAAAHDAKRIGCATRTQKCSRGRGASAPLARQTPSPLTHGPRGSTTAHETPSMRNPRTGRRRRNT